MLRVHLFGAGQLEFQNRRLEGFPNQQAYLLLCYLLINKPHPHHRERLAGVFWGDIPSVAARKYLRNSLWRLRQSLQSIGVRIEDYLYISEDSISFLASSDYWLDLDEFERATTRYLHLPERALSEQQIAELEEATDLYVGDLLANTYEDWCLYDRERMRLVYLNALEKLMVYHGIHHNPLRGLLYGERILALDNTQEKIHRQMMWLYWQSGDRTAAVSQYKRCCQVLREELNIRPMPETRQIYEQIMTQPEKPAGWIDNQRLEPSSHTAPPAPENVLSKLQQLQRAIEETRTELKHLESLLNEALFDL